MVNAGLWLNRQGPWADFAVFHSKSTLTPRRFTPDSLGYPHCFQR